MTVRTRLDLGCDNPACFQRSADHENPKPWEDGSGVWAGTLYVTGRKDIPALRRHAAMAGWLHVADWDLCPKCVPLLGEHRPRLTAGKNRYTGSRRWLLSCTCGWESEQNTGGLCGYPSKQYAALGWQAHHAQGVLEAAKSGQEATP